MVPRKLPRLRAESLDVRSAAGGDDAPLSNVGGSGFAVRCRSTTSFVAFWKRRFRFFFGASSSGAGGSGSGSGGGDGRVASRDDASASIALLSGSGSGRGVEGEREAHLFHGRHGREGRRPPGVVAVDDVRAHAVERRSYDVERGLLADRVVGRLRRDDEQAHEVGRELVPAHVAVAVLVELARKGLDGAVAERVRALGSERLHGPPQLAHAQRLVDEEAVAVLEPLHDELLEAHAPGARLERPAHGEALRVPGQNRSRVVARGDVRGDGGGAHRRRGAARALVALRSRIGGSGCREGLHRLLRGSRLGSQTKMQWASEMRWRSLKSQALPEPCAAGSRARRATMISEITSTA